MKTKIISALAAVGMVSAAFGQGVIFDNAGNTGNQSALISGLVYNSNGSKFDGNNFNLGVDVYTSATGSGYTLLQSFTPSTDSKGYTGLDLGQFQLGPAFTPVNIPGVTPGNPAFFELKVWSGSSFGAGTLKASYASASGVDPTADVFFSVVTSNPGGSPPTPAGNFSTMPSFTLQVSSVPEPTTLALAGLGGLASLVAFRRKQS